MVIKLPKRYTYEQVKKIFEEHGYNLLEKEYINNRTKMLVEKDGYYGFAKLDAIQRGDYFSICHKSNPYSIQNIQHYLDKKETGAKILSTEYRHQKENLVFQCSCGNIFYRCLSDLQQTTYAKCPECTSKLRAENRNVEEDIVKKEFLQAGYKILEMDYKNIDSRILCQDLDGYIGTFSLHGLRSGRRMNPWNYKTNSKETIIYNLNLYLHKKGRKLKVIDFIGKTKEYTANIVRCVCPICGNEFNIPLATLRFGKDCCFECVNVYSQYSIKVEKWLKEHNVSFVREKKFKDCTDKKELPFDFFLGAYNCCIEVDGEGHFRPVNFKGIPDGLAEEHYKTTVYHDELKNEYCKANGIKLVRISYLDIKSKKYKQILANIIKD